MSRVLGLLARLLNSKQGEASGAVSCLFCVYEWMCEVPDSDGQFQ